MSVDANALERETLERKDREELQKIVGALGGKATSRTRKADLIDQILELTGVTAAPEESADTASTGDEKAKPDDAGSSSGSAKGRGSAASTGKSEPSTSDTKAPAKNEADNDDESAAKSDAEADAQSDAKADGKSDSGAGTGGAKSGAAGRNGQNGGRGQAKNNDGSSDRDASGSGGDNDGQKNDDDSGDGEGGGKRRRRRGRNRDGGQQEEYTGEPIPVVGCLDLRDDGYGFLRVDGLLPSKDDCYVSVKQVRQFGLRKGDVIAGGSRPAFRNEKNPAMLRIDTINGVDLAPGTERPQFEELRATFPTELIALTLDDEPEGLTARAIDLLAPIGKGSRVAVLAPPRSGKTTLLQTIARSVEVNEPDASLIVVLLDERPEEISEMESVVTNGVVHGAAFDAPAEDQVALIELALAGARRTAEAGGDVIVLVDGLTRLARASHAASQGVGRSLGGLDVAAIQTAKRAFGAGRNLTEAGTITIVATASVDTAASADEAVVDAIMGAANCHIRLDGFAAARRAFPALDVAGTSTRHEDYLVGDDQAVARENLRRNLASGTELSSGRVADNTEQLDTLLERLRETGSNEELLAAVATDEKA